jgi:8-oxo-dGTP pyrophosphatase MutT (NUDIX family)
MSVKKVKDLPFDLMLRFRRAGIIGYKKMGSTIEFVLGIDRQSGDISNFGGTIKLSDGSPVTAAVREFLEESLYVFGYISADRTEECLAFYDSDELIIFYPLKYDRVKAAKKFNQLATAASEMKSLAFYTDNEFVDILANDGSRIYSRVRDLLVNAMHNNENWYSILSQ